MRMVMMMMIRDDDHGDGDDGVSDDNDEDSGLNCHSLRCWQLFFFLLLNVATSSFPS